MIVKLLPNKIINCPNKRIKERFFKRYPLGAQTSLDFLKGRFSKLSYKTVAKSYYSLPLNKSGENSQNRLKGNHSIIEKIETIKNEWNIIPFHEIEVIGDKVKILDYYFDLEVFAKQYSRLIDCLYYFDYSYCETYEEDERANSSEGEYLYTSLLDVCPIDTY